MNASKRRYIPTTLENYDAGGNLYIDGAAFLCHADAQVSQSRIIDNRTTALNGESAGLTASGGEFTLPDSRIKSNSANQKAPFSGGLNLLSAGSAAIDQGVVTS